MSTASMVEEATHVATRAFTYGKDGNGDPFEVYPGQYLEPGGLRNDRLIFATDSRMVTPAPAPRAREDWPCDRCGRHFNIESALRGHQQRTYQVENVARNHVASLKEQAATRVGRELKNETLADLAQKKGYKQVGERKGPHGSTVPIIEYPS